MKDLKLVIIDPLADFSTAAYGWECPACGHTVDPMGVLGTREHGRCRSCGADSSRSAQPLDPEDQLLLDEEGFDPFPASEAPQEDEPEPFANDWKPQP